MALGESVKRMVWAVLLGFVLALVAACGNDSDNGDAAPTETRSGLNVVATTTIIADLARNVAGDRASVTAIIPAGADPHDFEPTPSDIDDIDDADLVLEHGLDYDSWAHNLVEQSGTDAVVAVVNDGVATIATETDEESHQVDGHDHEHGDVDPHVWFDVKNVKVMVADIRDALIEVDPPGKDAYEANCDAYLAQLDELDGWIHEQVATIPEANRKLVTSHEAFGYYVAAYGFEYVGSIVSSLDSQAQPSARQVDALLDLIEDEKVPAVFTEKTLNPDLARQIADEAGVKVVTDLYSDSLSDDQDSGATTYIEMMRHNTSVIVDALT
jgi:ABC-type Zn uptake system ZnuABC Zn-binding protein ZnuA